MTYLATGGTITTVDGYEIHTFLTNGTLTPSKKLYGCIVEVVGAGGGGGGTIGGGGAGGQVLQDNNVTISSVLPVVIGTGGVGNNTGGSGSAGGYSSLGGLVAPGGNGGEAGNDSIGGHGGASSGFTGGFGAFLDTFRAGGGAGSGADGQNPWIFNPENIQPYNGISNNGPIWLAGSGGIGTLSNIPGDTNYYGGGGGGAEYGHLGGGSINGGNGTGHYPGDGVDGGSRGGHGGFGAYGYPDSPANSGNASANTGGGAGGNYDLAGGPDQPHGSAGTGGSGIVMVAIPTAQPTTTTTTTTTTSSTTTPVPTTTSTTTTTTTSTTTTPAPETYSLTMSCSMPPTASTTTPSPMIPQESLPRVRQVVKVIPSGTTLPTPAGDSILIIGSAVDGPTEQIVDVSTVKSLENLFGPVTYNQNYPSVNGLPIGSYNGNGLLKAAYEAIQGGARNLRLLRVGGNYAVAPALSNFVTVQSVYPGEIYNGATLTLSYQGQYLQITATQPAGKGKTFSTLYTSGTTLAGLCSAFNQDPHNNTFALSVQPGQAGLSCSTLASGTVTLVSGSCGTLLDDFTGSDRSAYVAAIQQQLELLDDDPVDILYCPDVYADDDLGSPAESFVTTLANFCYWRSQTVLPIHAVIGVRPILDTSPAAIARQVQHLMVPNSSYDQVSPNLVNTAQFLQNGIQAQNGGDAGAYVSVVAGPDLVFSNQSLGPYNETAAGFYCGLISQLDTIEAATHQPLPQGTGLSFEFSQRQLNQLNGGVGFVNEINSGTVQGGGAYVTFRGNPYQGGYCVTEDVTAARRNSAYRNLQTLRISQQIETAVQAVASRYVGADNLPSTISALDSNLQTCLNGFVTSGVLQGARTIGYDYTLGSTVNTTLIGAIQISLWIKPFGQIHRIDSLLSVSQNS